MEAGADRDGEEGRRTEAEFHAFYERELLPDLRRIDRERKVVRFRIVVVWLLTLAFIVLAFAVGHFIEGRL
jgi:hypothetical protein